MAKQVRAYFSERVEDTFRNGYYAKPTGLDEEDGPWTMSDIESEVAPHAAVPIFYSGLLAHFERIDDIADELVTRHSALHQRIDNRLGVPFAELSPEDEGHG